MSCRSRRFNARVDICATMLMFLSHILQLFAQEDPALRKLKLSKRYKSNIERLTRGAIGGPETHPRNGVSPLRPVSLDNIGASPKSKVKLKIPVRSKMKSLPVVVFGYHAIIWHYFFSLFFKYFS